jgi:hypothetical protein
MDATRRKLVIIVCEAGLEESVADEVMRLGAHGYTVSDARGSGARGRREATWPASGNIRMEVVCDEQAARAIAARLQTGYFENYAMVLYVADVEVLRANKF